MARLAAEIPDPFAFVRRALDDELAARRPAYLRPSAREECEDFLLAQLVEAAAAYDPSRGRTLREWAYWLVRRRYTDWLRKDRVDTRHGEMPDIVSSDALSEVGWEHSSKDEAEITQLIAELDHAKLSARSRGTLFGPALALAEEDLSRSAVAARYEMSPAKLREDLDWLKDELEELIT